MLKKNKTDSKSYTDDNIVRGKAFSVFTITDAISSLIVLISGVILARLLPKTQLGIYREITFVYSFVVPFMLLEFPTAILYFLPRFKGEDRWHYIGFTYLYSVIAGIVFILIFFFLSPFFETYGTKVNGTASLFLLISIAAPFTFITTFFRQILITIRELKTLFFFGMVYALLSFLPVLAYFFAINNRTELQVYLIFAVLIQNAICSMLSIYWFISNKERKYDLPQLNLHKLLKFSIQTWKEQFNYSIYFVARLPMVLLAKDFAKLIIMGFLSADSFATYTIGAVVIPFLPTLRTALVNTLVPEVAKEYHETCKISRKTLNVWRRATQLLAFIIIPAFVFLEVFGYEFIVGLYTKKYINSVPIFRVFLILIISYLFGYDIFLQGIGRTRPIFISSIIFLATNISTSLVLFKYFGLIGPAIGTIIANFISAAYLWNEARKVLGEEPFGSVLRKSFLKIFIESLLAAIIMKSILFFAGFALNYLIQLAIGLVGSACLVLLIWYFRYPDILIELISLAKIISKK